MEELNSPFDIFEHIDDTFFNDKQSDKAYFYDFIGKKNFRRLMLSSNDHLVLFDFYESVWLRLFL